MSDAQNQAPVSLVDPNVPADQGLSSLGLLMQLGGSLFAAVMTLATFTALLALGARGGGGGENLVILLLLGVSLTRSIFHRMAGTELLYGKPSFEGVSRLGGVKRYIAIGLAHSAMVFLILSGKFHMDMKLALGIGLGCAAWPVTLAVLMTLPRFRRFNTEMPVAEDKGFEAASILMTVLGLCGLLGGAVVLVLMVQAGSELTKGAGVLLVLTTAMLVVRSFIHVQAGFSGLRETSVDRSVELANRYANFGVISSFCGGGALLLWVMTSAVSVAGMALITGLVWMLMAWPLIIRRFFSDRQFVDLLAGDNAPIHRRAPDAGITALGWFLFAYSIMQASFMLPSLFGGSEMREMGGMLPGLMGGGGGGFRSMWWTVGELVLQGWAGYEPVRMSPQSRIIATIYGLVGGGVTIFMNYPLLHNLKHMRGVMGAGSVGIAMLALSLVIPVATIVLVNRKLAPTARARFKSKPTTGA